MFCEENKIYLMEQQIQESLNVASPIEKLSSSPSFIGHSYIDDDILTLKERKNVCKINRYQFGLVLVDAKFYGVNDVLLLYRETAKQKLQGEGVEEEKEEETCGCYVVWWNHTKDCLKKIFSFDKNTFNTLTVHEKYVWLSENAVFKLWKPEFGNEFVFEIKPFTDIENLTGKIIQTCVYNRSVFCLRQRVDGEYRLDCFNRYGKKIPQPLPFKDQKELDEADKILSKSFILCVIENNLYILNKYHKFKFKKALCLTGQNNKQFEM